MTAENRTRQLARSTLIVMIAFATAKLVSLAQVVIIARQFGIEEEWDAYVSANRIPETIFTLIAGGALAHAFIPIFAGFLAQEDREGAWRTASRVINTVFSLTFVVSAIVFLFAPWLVANVTSPGFNPDTQAQTAELMRILLISTLIFSVSGIVMGILQSHNHFLLPALAPIMFDVGILMGVLILMPILGVNGIALGAVFGAALHLLIQIPGLIRVRAQWHLSLGFNDPMVRRIFRLMLPRVAGLGVISLNFLVMNNIASRLGTGSVAALDWGWRLMQIPQTLIGTAMGTVIFPTLAALSEVGDENGKRAAMSGALRFILIGSIPAAVGLIFVGRPILRLLEGGAFQADASLLVYTTLQFFALGIIVHSALEVVARSFYADKDTLTPLWTALGGSAINLSLAFALSNVAFAESAISAQRFANPVFSAMDALPVYGNVAGLAIANTVGVAFEVSVLLLILRQRWHGIEENTLARTVLKTTAASLVMALAIVIVNAGWQMLGFDQRGTLFTILQVIVETSVGLMIFILMAALLKMEELGVLIDIVLRRQKPKGLATA
ncbi:MAG: murein biosynthesis integral membrane protein MurJ [Anaerolineae bacterium]|jgi:putative peptidoglycan lipid II flippase|nr:murein biosynthesis integral membrane protein MurJ [Anaerolineae bacterium]